MILTTYLLLNAKSIVLAAEFSSVRAYFYTRREGTKNLL